MSGSNVIPATQRADGTWRKERRVKEGYVPQDEVAVYESRGKQWAQKPVGPVGLPPQLQAKLKAEQEKKPTNADLRKASKNKPMVSEGVLASDRVLFTKPAPSSQKQAKAPKPSDVDEVTKSVTKISVTDDHGEGDKTKKIRNLRKKLKEIDALEQKIASGELTNPDPDQVKKINRKSEVQKELTELENS